MVGLDTDGGGNHNHKHIRNQLALFGLFILGNTENLNLTHGCPGISFLSTSERAMDFLNIGLSGLVLKYNIQLGDGILKDGVIGN